MAHDAVDASVTSKAVPQQPQLPSALDAVKEAGDAEEAFFKLQAWSKSDLALRASADQVEQELFRGGMEIQRRLLEENMRARGRGDVGKAVVVLEDADDCDENNGRTREQRLWRRQNHSRQYESLFGEVHVERLGYSVPGEKSLHPLDEELNLPRRRYSYPVQERVALRAGRGPFDEVVDEVQRTTAAKVPKRQVEQIVEDAAQDFDAFYAECRQTTIALSEGTILAVGLDCKGVPRRKSKEELAEPQPTRLGPGEKRTKKKMATVASVHTCDPHYSTAEEIVANLVDGTRKDESTKASKKRPRIENRRLWASVRKSKDEVFQEVCAEMQLRDPERTKRVVCAFVNS